MTETGWLIETTINGYAEWLMLDDYNRWEWTQDSFEALRFAREKDAKIMMKKLQILGIFSLHEDVFATEHTWYNKENFEKIDTIEQQNSYLKQKNQYLELELRKANERIFSPNEILHRTIEIQKENLDKKDAEIANLKKQRDEYNEGVYNYIKVVVCADLYEENKKLTKCKESAKLKIEQLSDEIVKLNSTSISLANELEQCYNSIKHTRREAMIMAKEMMKLRPDLKAHFDSDAWNIAKRIAR